MDQSMTNVIQQMQNQMMMLTNQLATLQAGQVGRQNEPRVHVGFVRNGDLPTYDGKIRKEEDLSNWMMQMDALFRANNQTSNEYKINQLPVGIERRSPDMVQKLCDQW